MTDLIHGGALSAQLDTTRYRVPEELEAVSMIFLRQKLREQRWLIPGPMLGWGRIDRGVVELKTGNYFDYLRTNILATRQTSIEGQWQPHLGRDLYVQYPEQIIVESSDSILFNGVGVSTIALTTDAHIVVIQESAQNMDQNRRARPRAPSGSGGLEPIDMSRSSNVREVLEAGAARELMEEAAVSDSELESTHFLGFGRWLTKAANPEAFCVTFLKASSSQMRGRKINKGESGYVRRIETYRLTPEALAVGVSVKRILGETEDQQGSSSLPLAVNLDYLQREASSATATGKRIYNLVHEQSLRVAS